MARCSCGRFATPDVVFDWPVVWCANPSHDLCDMVKLQVGRDKWVWKMRVTLQTARFQVFK